MAHLTGKRWMDVPATRVRALSEAIVGNFRFLSPPDGEGLPDRNRVDWARNAMAELIDAEIDGLLAHRETLDLEAIERDRAGAAGRSAFDPSREAILARKYEAAAERAVYKALDELRRFEAEGPASGAGPAEFPEEEADGQPSGSFGAGNRAAVTPAPRSAPVFVSPCISAMPAGHERRPRGGLVGHGPA